MKILVERSGGFAGIPVITEIDTDDLPNPLILKVNRIMNNPPSTQASLRRIPRAAADYYTYKISILNGPNKRTIVCNEYDLHADLKSFIKYVEKKSK